MKVLDFGLAKAVDASERSMTRTGTVLGTPQYMSPEQADGATLDAGTDLYSFAAVLFEALTASRYVKGEGMMEALLEIYQEQRPPVSSRWPAANAAIDTLFAEALCRRAARTTDIERWADALAAELRQMTPHEGWPARGETDAGN